MCGMRVWGEVRQLGWPRREHQQYQKQLADVRGRIPSNGLQLPEGREVDYNSQKAARARRQPGALVRLPAKRKRREWRLRSRDIWGCPRPAWCWRGISGYLELEVAVVTTERAKHFYSPQDIPVTLYSDADEWETCVIRAWDCRKPLLFCPAMNTAMWEHPVTAQQVGLLKAFGYVEIPCVVKKLVCGDEGLGAMAEVGTIVDKVKEVLFCRGSSQQS
ncbi:phosphopantothenoylcysteine decarboxylase isoform X2 [Panthera pardus]|uniref:Phosphopantothenoylcysteine decarboxylase isoform X2 n=1 Tax=Panthera pardus TaxID=9691 RepID=A0A9V1F6Y1_PANPR|nr:phosphopantothenoylcysteine decarboxylase isoform X2 [Panthera pardus]